MSIGIVKFSPFKNYNNVFLLSQYICLLFTVIHCRRKILFRVKYVNRMVFIVNCFLGYFIIVPKCGGCKRCSSTDERVPVGRSAAEGRSFRAQCQFP